MASRIHERYVELFRNQPALAPELLKALKVPLPDYNAVRTGSVDLSQVGPTEFRADSVVVLTRSPTDTAAGAHTGDADAGTDAHPGAGRGTGGGETPADAGLTGQDVAAVVVEVQLRPDKTKRLSWPVYLATLRSRIKCPSVLLVICHDQSTAHWCAQPIDMGHPGWILRPLVLDQTAVPMITDVQAAREAPELLVLSALAHGPGPHGEAVLKTTAEALPTLGDEDKSLVYTDFVLAALPEVARSILEAHMPADTWVWQSGYAKKWIGIGRTEGKAEGKAEGEAEAVVVVLTARGIHVPDHVADRVRACTELDQLKTWIHKAATITTADELFT